mmetsp:Transcript_21264/g.33955  ORF Transcript_21264/g.33955 Transcript_21264/m.33955 type:complete len:209 (-) Transcript_21264:898-1524(-)
MHLHCWHTAGGCEVQLVLLDAMHQRAMTFQGEEVAETLEVVFLQVAREYIRERKPVELLESSRSHVVMFDREARLVQQRLPEFHRQPLLMDPTESAHQEFVESAAVTLGKDSSKDLRQEKRPARGVSPRSLHERHGLRGRIQHPELFESLLHLVHSSPLLGTQILHVALSQKHLLVRLGFGLCLGLSQAHGLLRAWCPLLHAPEVPRQ